MVLLGLAAVAGAEPLVAARGDSLATFDVVAKLGGVDRSSAEALAGSYRRYLDEQGAVDRRFARLFREAHLAVLRRVATPDVVAREASAAAPPAAPPVRLARVVNGDETFAYLERGGRGLRLRLAPGPDGWRIAAMHAERPGHGWIARPLGAPPRTPRVTVPAAAAPDRSTPAATVGSLRAAMARLRAQRTAAALRQQRHFFAITEAFWGAAAAGRATKERPEAPAAPAFRFRIGDPAPAEGGRQRIDVIATELAEGEHRPVGHAAFDLARGADGWRVAAESHRTRPDGPLEPVTRNHGLIFFLGS